MRNPLEGITLEQIVTQLQAHYGWPSLAERVRINCFAIDPSIKSSLKLFMLREQKRAPRP